MTIETKYNIGDEVFWVGYDGDWHQTTICGVLFIDGRVLYMMKESTIGEVIYTSYVEEKDVFPTKEELLQSL
jgi:hypothetical protein